jgi:hypothetical protein
METNDERLSLVNIKGGALLEAVDIRLNEIVENLKDPNTTDDKRELLKLSSSQTRNGSLRRSFRPARANWLM